MKWERIEKKSVLLIGSTRKEGKKDDLAEKGETERAKDGRKRSEGEEGIGALQFRAKHSHDGPIARRDTDAARSCKGSRPMSESGVNHHTLLWRRMIYPDPWSVSRACKAGGKVTKEWCRTIRRVTKQRGA